ncbi:MAG TPA: DHA2 family efflux MFS transporter permease subunit [Parafilimonas sp.]|nr:DHA2 family efflux MFS transporter permease subunit [Parafilimonas sp.]
MAEHNSLVEYGSRRAIITITAVFCALLEIIDTTIVNVALPNMRGSLGATLSEVSWVITAYSIANVIIVPMTSWLSQQFGRRNYFAASVIIFTIASFLCGNSTSITELIIFRFIQGLGGGALLVTSQTIIIETYPPEKRAMGQAIYVIGVIIGPTLGPPLGGYIVDHFSWPYIFYINIPVGIIAALLTLQYIRSPKYAEKRAARDVDWLGIFLLTIAVGSLQYILEKGQEDDWFSSKLIITLTAAAILAFYCFIWRENVYKYPVVELKVFRNGNLRMGVLLSFIQGFGLFGSTFIIPLYTQGILGWDAFQSGMLMIPSTLMVAFMMPIIGQMIQRGVSQKYLIAIGMIIFFLYCLMTYKVMTPHTSAENFFWPLMVRGMGLGLLSVPISTMALSTLKGVEIGQGAAFTGMMRQLGGSFGVAMISTYLTRDIVSHRGNLVTHLNMYDPAVQDRVQAMAQGMQQKGMSPDVALKSAYEMLNGSVSLQATILSYMDIFLYVGCMFLVCVPIVLIFIKKSRAKLSMAEAAH